jgi:SAM-dependent methyltransferase
MKRYRAIAAYYDAEYADTKILQQDVPFFLGHLPKKKQSVLELCVGTARAAIPIAQAGHRVVGVDYDRALLDIAERKRDFVGLTKGELQLRLGDVLTLSLTDRFDWICLFFNTLLAFPTLDEQDRLLGVIRRHLKPRGRFWLDIFQPDLQLLAGGHTRMLDPRMFHVPALDRTVQQTTEIKRDTAKQIQDVTFNYTWFDDRGRKRQERNRFTLTWMFARELQLLLERNGLVIEHLYGNYDGSAVKSDSPRLIACCTRAA